MATENMRLEDTIAEKDRVIAEKDRVIAGLEEEMAGMQRDHEEEMAGMRADYGTEMAGLNALIRMLREKMEGTESDNKRLAASDRAHNSAHAPPATRTWHAERRKREAVRKRHARQTAWRPPGRSIGHKGVTHKMRTNRPDDHRRPRSCSECKGSNLGRWSTTFKQNVDIEKIVVAISNVFFHDGECLDCGAAVRAPRDGTLDGTLASPRTMSVLYHVWTETHCSAEAVRVVARYGFGIKLGRTAVSNMINVGSDLLGPPANEIRGTMDVKQEDGEMDEAHYRMGVWVDCGGRRMREKKKGRWLRSRRQRAGIFAADGDDADEKEKEEEAYIDDDEGLSASPSGRRREIRAGYIHAACDSMRVNVCASPTRSANVLKGRFADRVTARTATDGNPVYGICKIHQRDHVHELREIEALAWSTGDPNVARIAEQLGDVLAQIRRDADRPGGAFPDPDIGKVEEMHRARLLGLADELKKAGYPKAGARLEAAAPLMTMCLPHPGLSGTTVRIEQVNRRFGQDRNTRGALVSPEGRRRYGNSMTCRESWRMMGRNPFYMLQEIFGVTPSAEWAQIRMEGDRAAALRPVRAAGGPTAAAQPCAGAPFGQARRCPEPPAEPAPCRTKAVAATAARQQRQRRRQVPRDAAVAAAAAAGRGSGSSSRGAKAGAPRGRPAGAGAAAAVRRAAAPGRGSRSRSGGSRGNRGAKAGAPPPPPPDIPPSGPGPPRS